MPAIEYLLDDLAAESAELDALVADLSDADWQRDTPADGWTVADQIAHLAWTDDIALLAVAEPDRLRQLSAGFRPNLIDATAHEGAATAPNELLVRWRAGRTALSHALRGVPAGATLPWIGVTMGAPSMVTARIMETWAHGQDIADTLSVHRRPTARLRHVAHLGVATRDFAFRLHGQDPPGAPFRVELVGPENDCWTWGPDDAPQRVTGLALDFCLLVTQRRNRDDLAVQAAGPDAEAWLSLAQAFAGAPGPGRPKASTP
ncbi:MAG: TIGR03084 family metal-binding protein [Jatrophihabitans sp.]